MGIRVCEGEDATFLYCSTTMRPVNTEAFESEEAAESFLLFCAQRDARDVRALPAAVLSMLHAEWLSEPQCEECGGHGVCPETCTREEAS